MIAPPGVEPRIVINDPAGSEQALALGAPFDSVVKVSIGGGWCSGSLISTTTVLTAQHCLLGEAADNVTVRFTEGGGAGQFNRAVTDIDLMPGYSFLNDGTDLAVLTLDTPVTERTPFRLLADFVLGETVRFVGYGFNGVGSVGHGGTSTDARWAADNVIDAWSEGEDYSGFNSLYYSDFDDPDGTANTLNIVFGVTSSPDMLAAEGTTAPGDSGGPLLVRRGSEWVIAGVLSGGVLWSAGPAAFPQNPSDSAYGDISFWTGLTSPEAQSFVRSGGGVFAIPLPGAGWLLLSALGLVGVLRGRRRG